jgi:muconolactone delta-isomerase
MRFLIVTRATSPLPPPMTPMLVAGMKQWSAAHRESGKLEQVWSFAGMAGGGGILNVDSHEELDEIMAGFPFGPFSHIELYPLADLDAGLDNLEKSMQQMMGGGVGGADFGAMLQQLLGGATT